MSGQRSSHPQAGVRSTHADDKRPTIEAERIALKRTLAEARARGSQFVGYAVVSYREDGRVGALMDASRILSGPEANEALRRTREKWPHLLWRRVRVEVAL